MLHFLKRDFSQSNFLDQDFAIYGTYVAEQSSGELATSLMYVSFFDIKNRKRSVD